jgi:hypothetical protein
MLVLKAQKFYIAFECNDLKNSSIFSNQFDESTLWFLVNTRKIIGMEITNDPQSMLK